MRHYAQDLRTLAASIDAAAAQKERLAASARDQREKRRAHKKRVETVANMMLEGRCDHTIAQAIGRPESAVDVFKAEALKHIRTDERIRRNRRIVDLWKSGASNPDIAAAVGLHVGSVKRILRDYRLNIQTTPTRTATSSAYDNAETSGLIKRKSISNGSANGSSGSSGAAGGNGGKRRRPSGGSLRKMSNAVTG